MRSSRRNQTEWDWDWPSAERSSSAMAVSLLRIRTGKTAQCSSSFSPAGAPMRWPLAERTDIVRRAIAFGAERELAPTRLQNGQPGERRLLHIADMRE